MKELKKWYSNVRYFLGLGGVIKMSTLLTAQKKVLTPEGLELIANGVDLQELAKTRPELWQPEGKPRVVKNRVVTTAFVNYVVDNLIAEVAAFGDFKFHEMGLGTTAEAAGDTALETTTGIARATGTQVEGDTANVYKTVATITADATEAITEHGIFNIATAGTMMDRTVFSAINVVSGNQIEFTFSITFSSGS